MPDTFTFIIDFTYDGSNNLPLRIIRFRDIFRSGLLEFNRLSSERLQSIVLKNLNQKYPQAVYMEESFPDVILHDFSQGTKARYMLSNEQSLHDFLYARAQQGALESFERPLIVSFRTLMFSTELRMHLDALQQKTPLKFLNYPRGVFADVCQDSMAFHQLAKENPLCVPTLLIDLLDPDEAAVERFLKDNPQEHFVLKPGKPEGFKVDVVAKKDVLSFIDRMHQIAACPDHQFHADFLDLESWNYLGWRSWLSRTQNNAFVLVQPCCPSKQMELETKHYYPTGHMIIEAHFDGEKCDIANLPNLNILASHWSLPGNAVEEKEDRISDIGVYTRVLPICPEDQQAITEQLNTHLRRLLATLWTTDFRTLPDFFEDSPALQRYQCNLGLSAPKLLPVKNLALCFPDIICKNHHKQDLLTYFKNQICNPSPNIQIPTLLPNGSKLPEEKQGPQAQLASCACVLL